MDDRQRTLQRYIDGRLGAGETGAVQHLLASDPAARAEVAALEQLDRALKAEASAHVLDESSADSLVAGICAELPSKPPERQQHLRLVDLALATAALSGVALFYGLAGSLRDLVPLTALAVVSLIVGILLVVMAGPLRRIESSFFGRLLNKRLNIGSGDLLVYRVTGIAIVVGGIWLLREFA